MKISIFYTLLACFALTCMQVNAQSLTKIYSGDKSPAEAGWAELKMDETISPAAGVISQEVADGVLKLRANDAEKFTQLGWYKTDLGLSLMTGYTIEIKAKVTNASQYGAFNIQSFDNTGRGFRLGIYKDYVAEATNPLVATNVLKPGLSNDDDFHIYRIVAAPTQIVTIYRDEEELGTFPLSSFYFDNIITNGGFEDGGDDFDNAAFFPDFQTRGLLYRTDEPAEKPAGYVIKDIDTPDEKPLDWVKSGNYSLIMNSNGKYETNDDNHDPEISERLRTREIPVKADTKYDVSFSRARIASQMGAEPNSWAWRDMGAFYDFQPGTQDVRDDRGWNAIFAGANDDWWQTHNQTITTPAEDADDVAESLRFEFPSWWRGDNGGSGTAITAFDDFYVSEKLDIVVGQEVSNLSGPVFPNNIDAINLIKNGDFSDPLMNNDGTEYEWALSNPDDANNNGPTAYNPMWNGEVRIQRNDKPDDQVGGDGGWAHSSEASLRFSSHGNHGTFEFVVELEANKKYRFNFWHRTPHWGETAWVKVKIGDNDIWGHNLGSWRNNVWTNADMTFETTATEKTLRLYADDYGDWYNIFFDDFVLYEIESLEDLSLVGKTNLIANGDFEDDALGNDGEYYYWALASDDSRDNEDYPVLWSDVWGAYVRLQDKQKAHDTGLQWAHSGNKSLRMSYLNNGPSQEAIEDFGVSKDARKTNMNFVKELEPNKTYTFVFWMKTANYDDRGNLMISNGDILVWKEALSTKYINWSRQSVTFTTTEADYTLRIWTDWTNWYNFYLDDLFLYEEETVLPLASENTFLFFGKSMGAESTDVEIEYVSIDNTGAYPPTGIKNPTVAISNLKVGMIDSGLSFRVVNPAAVKVYTVTGMQVAQLNVEKEANIALPQGIYIVRSVANGVTETVKTIVR